MNIYYIWFETQKRSSLLKNLEISAQNIMILECNISIQTIVISQDYPNAICPPLSMTLIEGMHMGALLFMEQPSQMGLGKLLLSNTSHCISDCVSKPVTND